MTIKIVLIDDSPIFLAGLKENLADAEIEVVGEARNGVQGQRLVRQKQPDIVLLDFRLPDATGMQMCDFIQSHFSHIGVLLFVSEYDLPLIGRLVSMSIRGIATKNSRYPLIEVVKSVYHGDHYLQPDMAWDWIQFQQRHAQDSVRTLTDKEYQVLSLIARGKTSDQIAEIRHISLKTVFNLKSSGYKKLGITKGESLTESFFKIELLSSHESNARKTG